MSASVDERIVQMKFENGQFERAAKESLGTMQKLKNGLNFEGAVKGIAEVEKSVRSFSLDAMGSAIQSVTDKFTALDAVGFRVITRLTDQAINFGKKMIASLTTDQISSGFSKYEQQTSYVQTLMNATGKTIDEIDGYLAKLMWFSDETSYGFTDMASALSQMVTVGGNIDTLTPLLMGVANATAFAGKGAQEYSRIMYNLSQSYAAGYLTYQDWKSVEQAGGASVQLKESLIEAAEQLNIIEKGSVTLGNFSETLTKDKWATREVMEKGFGMFAEMSEMAYQMVQSGEVETATEAYEILGQTYDNVAFKAARSAQEAKTFGEAIDATKDAVSSQWMETFKIIFGNYKEAKVLWTDLSNTLWDLFASGGEARNEFFREWKELGGRDSAIQSVKNLFHGLMSVIQPVQEAFSKVFSGLTATKFADMTKGFENLTASLRLTETGQKNLSIAFEGFFRILKVVRDAIGLLFKALGQVLKLLNPLVTVILYVAGAIGRVVNAIFSIFESVDNLWDLLGSIKSWFSNLKNIFTIEGGGLKGALEVIFAILSQAISQGFEFMGDVLDKDLKELQKFFLSKFKAAFAKLKSAILTVAKAFQTGDWSQVVAYITAGFNMLNNAVNGFFDDIAVSYIEGGEGFSGVVEVIFDQMAFAVRDGFNIVSKVTGMDLSNLRDTWVNKIFDIRNSVVDALFNLKQSIENFDWEALGLQPIINFLGGVVESIKAISVELGNAVKNLFDKLNPFKALEGTLSKLNSKITGSFGEMGGGIKDALSGMGLDEFIKILDTGIFGAVAFGLIKFALAISKLIKDVDTSFIERLGKTLEQVGKSVSDVLDEVGNALKTFQASVKAKIIRQIGVALAILAGALLVLGFIPRENLLQGILGITAALVELTAVIFGLKYAMKDMDPETMSSVGKGLVEVSTAVLILAVAAEKMAKIAQSGYLTPAFMAITGFISELVIVAMALDNMKHDFPKGASMMILLAISVNALVKAVKPLAEIAMIDVSALWNGVGAVAALVAVMTLASTFISAFGKDLKLKGLIQFGTAVLIISYAVKMLGTIPLEQAQQGLEAVMLLMRSMVMFEAVTALAKDMDKAGVGALLVAVSMIALASAVKMLGKIPVDQLLNGSIAVATLLAAVTLSLRNIPEDAPKRAAGVLVLAAALNVLAIALSAFALLSQTGTAVGGGLFIIAVFLTEIAVALNALKETTEGAVALLIFSGALVVLTAALTAFSLVPFPLIIIGLIELAAALAIVIAAGYLANGAALGLIALGMAFRDIGIGMLGLGAGILFLGAGLSLLVAACTAAGAAIGIVASAIIEVVKAIIVGIGNGIVGFAQIIIKAAPVIAEAFATLIKAAIEKLPELLTNFLTFLGEMITAVVSFVSEHGPELIAAGLNFLIFLLTGIRTNIGEIVVTTAEIIANFIKGLSDRIGQIIDAGINFIVSFLNGLADGLRNNQQILIDAIINLGGALIDGLIAGLGAGITFVVDKVMEIGQKILSTIKEFFGIHSPSTVFEDIGVFLIEGLINGITGMIGKAVDAVAGLASKVTGLFKKDDETEDAAKGNMDSLISGYDAKEREAENTARTIIEKVLATIKSFDPRFLDAGKNSLANLIQGFKNKQAEAESTIRTLNSNIVSELRDQQDKWYDAGVYLIKGFIEAIEDNTWMAERAARIMAQRALEEAEEVFDVASPSKEFYRIGRFVVEGFANGVTDNTPYSTMSIGRMAEDSLDTMKRSIDRLSDYVSAEFDDTPVIRPVLDLDDVRNSAKKIDQLLEGSILDVSGIVAKAKNISGILAKTDELKGTDTDESGTVNYQFTQNNYSPKALSRLEIYRQTRNQFDAFQEEMKKE